LTQLARQKLNFIGLHSYPMQEPLVWVGDPQHLDADGNVAAAGGWPTSWRTTLDSNWGSSGLNTSEYHAGAALAFPAQCYGSPAMMSTQPFCTSEGADGYPKPGMPVSGGKAEAATFNAAADLVADAFKFGGHLGVLRAVGTEVPLGMKGCHNCHNDLPAGVSHEMALEGAFTRLQRKFGSDLDYYWHWTPECGISNGSTITNATVNPEPGQTKPFYQTALNDIQISIGARATANMTAQLATSGWGLGSQADHNSSLFDDIFGNEIVAFSALTANVGWQPVDKGYKQITKHQKWVIPWLEDDPGLLGAEMWANRTIAAAADARKYGINGLLGIHWRTFETSLTLQALARIAWEPELTVEQLYTDFATKAFGEAVGKHVGAILASIDSFKVGPYDLPAGATCYPGVPPPRDPTPGQPPSPPSQCSAKLPRPGFFCCSGYGVPHSDINLTQYDFALKFAALRPQVTDMRARETFDLWMNLLSYHRSIAIHQHAAYALNTAIANVSALPKSQQKDAGTKICLPLLSNLSRVYEQHLTKLLSFANSQGELGMLDEHESGFAKGGGNYGAVSKLTAMGVVIPQSALPTKEYLGEPRMFVISERTMVDSSSEKELNVSVVVLAKQSLLPSTISLRHRKLGASSFETIAMLRVAPDRGWYSGKISVAAVNELLGSGDFEYKVQAKLISGKDFVYPAVGTIVVTAMPH
jgi:hypothetical protein